MNSSYKWLDRSLMQKNRQKKSRVYYFRWRDHLSERRWFVQDWELILYKKSSVGPLVTEIVFSSLEI